MMWNLHLATPSWDELGTGLVSSHFVSAPQAVFVLLRVYIKFYDSAIKH